ncbi:SAM hydrolase/SAM-dependent halogenase family protein [Radicibacter daui]|uniref:SAM hydrolase/SAM-dependent halogenase family protein n=1 Tax=Radicibacter daui TaxID=3064829 RepID=UPI0040469255
MIFIATDFGLAGPYTGQMKAVLAAAAPGVPVIDLFADIPAFNHKAAAYLLGAYAPFQPADSTFLCVVDPGVGSSRAPVAVEADSRFFVGPDNGLFSQIIRRADACRAWRIDWQPPGMSVSFHGRDLFAPIAARLATKMPFERSEIDPATLDRPDWPDDLAEVIYHDHYGNVMTGLRTHTVPAGARLIAGGKFLPPAHTFSSVPQGEAFWYGNSNGLAEIAVNQGRAGDLAGLAVGDPIRIVT